MLPLRAGASLQKVALTSLVFGLCASPLAFAREADVVAAGPVEGIDCVGGVARVLGISFHAESSTAGTALCSIDASSGATFVVAKGQAANNGVVRLITFQIVSTGQYVQGASPIYLRGPVTSAKPTVGELTIYGAKISASGPTPSVGTKIEVLGSQPLLGGVLLSAQIISVNAVERRDERSDANMLSSVVQSSSGSGLQSSSGSGLQSSSGSGLQSSSGSGLQSSSGSGLQSSSGSGLQSSSGSGLLSSSGSGK